MMHGLKNIKLFEWQHIINVIATATQILGCDIITNPRYLQVSEYVELDIHYQYFSTACQIIEHTKILTVFAKHYKRLVYE